MSGWTERYNEIRQTHVTNASQRVFLVEGIEDEDAYFNIFTNYFHKHFSNSNWESKWVISYAGGKDNVYKILKKEPNWLGLVDKDEWNQGNIDAKCAELPNLIVLPRFCMESYLIHPQELWNTIPEQQKIKVAGGYEFFKQEILRNLDKAVRHGVLWYILNPMWNDLYLLGFNEALLDINDVPDDTYIQTKLKEWYGLFDPNKIFESFKQLLDEVNSKDESEKLTKWVHGKKFWTNQVSKTLNNLFGQREESKWRKDLWKQLSVPADWQPIWDRIGQI